MTTCGTYAGYQRHLRTDGVPCEPCRLARNAYRNQRLAENPAAQEKSNQRSAAWRRAVRRLMQEHQDRFRELYDEEKDR